MIYWDLHNHLLVSREYLVSSTCVDEDVKSEENEQTGSDDRKGRVAQITTG